MPWTVPDMLKFTRLLLQQKIILPQMSVVPELRNPMLGESFPTSADPGRHFREETLSDSPSQAGLLRPHPGCRGERTGSRPPVQFLLWRSSTCGQQGRELDPTVRLKEQTLKQASVHSPPHGSTELWGQYLFKKREPRICVFESPWVIIMHTNIWATLNFCGWPLPGCQEL